MACLEPVAQRDEACAVPAAVLATQVDAGELCALSDGLRKARCITGRDLRRVVGKTQVAQRAVTGLEPDTAECP